MVAVGDGEWYAAVDQRLQERTDAGTHLGPRALDLAAPRRLPLPLAERVAVRVVVSGDLVAGEYDDVGARGVQRRLDQPDGVFGDLRTILYVRQLQHAELAGTVELETSQTRRDGHRALAIGAASGCRRCNLVEIRHNSQRSTYHLDRA